MGLPSKYPAEFREQAVEVGKASGKTVAEVACDLKINDTTLGNWVKADRAKRDVADETGLLSDDGSPAAVAVSPTRGDSQ